MKGVLVAASIIVPYLSALSPTASANQKLKIGVLNFLTDPLLLSEGSATHRDSVATIDKMGIIYEDGFYGATVKSRSTSQAKKYKYRMRGMLTGPYNQKTEAFSPVGVSSIEYPESILGSSSKVC